MKQSSLIILALILVVVLVGVIMWSNQGPAAPTPAPQAGNLNPPASPDVSAPAAKTLNVMTDPALGAYLAATNGMTVYAFTKDTPGVSNCSGVCIANWPPYIVNPATFSVAADITGTLGTITRTDGSIQLTYKGSPLYFWHGDSKPGDTTGNNVGGVWFVVKP